MEGAAAAPLEAPAERPSRRWAELVEKVAIGGTMAIVLSIGFYAIDFQHAAGDGKAFEPWVTEVGLDAAIPFWPIWVWPYLSYFPLCFLPLLFCAHHGRFRRVALAYSLTYVPSLIFFYLVPTKMIRPSFEATDLTMRAMTWLYEIDPGYNIFPSLHVANAVLVAWIFQRHAPRWAPLLWIEAALITASTVLVKQHYVVDLPAGVVLGTAAFFIAFRRIEVRPGDPDAPATLTGGDPSA